MMLNAMIEVRVREDSCIIHLYCDVPEEYSSMQYTRRRVVDLVDFSSCHPCLLQSSVYIRDIEAYVCLFRVSELFLRLSGFAFYLPFLERWLNVTV